MRKYNKNFKKNLKKRGNTSPCVIIKNDTKNNFYTIYLDISCWRNLFALFILMLSHPLAR